MKHTENLPKVNSGHEDSLRKQNELHLKLLKLIHSFSNENGLATYETDAVLLKIVSNNHKNYLEMKYGIYKD